MKAFKEIKMRLTDHLPFTKARHQVRDSSLSIRIKAYDGSLTEKEPWVEFYLTEYYTLAGGKREQIKQTMFTLGKDEMEKLKEILK